MAKVVRPLQRWRPNLADDRFNLTGRTPLQKRNATVAVIGAGDYIGSEIAGIEPAVAVDHLGRKLGGTIVAEHHVAPADMQFPDLTSCRRNAVERSDPRLYSRQQRANRLVRPRRIEAHA